MAEWPLVGRNHELTQLRALAGDLRCRGVALAAPAGVGKTRLARESMRDAGHARMPTLIATGSPAVARVPLGAMASTLSAFGGVVGSAHEDPSAFLQDAVRHLISRSSSDRVFLLVDDAHLLDNASAALVHQLAQRDEVFLLITLRTREPAPDAVTALWKDGLIERIELPVLDANAIEQLLVAVLGGPVDGGTVALLNARSQGNLLFLREMVSAARTDGTLRFEHELWRLVGDSAPSNVLVELVETNLRRLAAPERYLLELLSLGEPLGTRELETLSSVAVAERLEDLGILASRSDGQRLEVRLAHPVYGEVLRSRVTGLRSRRLAQSLAKAIEDTGMRRRDDALRVAVWRLTTGGGSPEQLLVAARAARWRNDLDLAHRLAEAAAAAGAGFEAELLQAQLLLRLGKPRDADAMFARLCSDADEQNRVRATLARVDIAQARGRPSEMRRLLDEIDPAPADPDLKAAIAARDCVTTLFLNGPNAALRVAVPQFDAARGDAAFGLYAARALCYSRAGRNEAAEQELALMDPQTGDLFRVGWWRIPNSSVVSQHLVHSGRLAESLALLEQQYAGAIAVGSAEMQMATAHSLARRHLDAGRPATAAKLAHEALAIAAQLTYELIELDALRLLALVEAQRGRTVASREALSVVEAADAETAYGRGYIAEARAWLAVAEGDVQGARHELADAAAFCERVGDRVPAATALHSLVRIGHPKDALDGLTTLAAEMEGPWAALYLQHARGVVDGDAASLDQTGGGFAALGAVLLAAETAADASSAWQRAGDPRRATAARNLATALASQCEGAQTPALRTLGEREQLTAVERETAEFAAAGESNRSIAERLHLSVRTIESRLQSAYHKLGVSRREDLADALATVTMR
jgi:DNA-binding CsgD family transcriptional regulator